MYNKHPIFLDLRNRLVVVIGGGVVAERKIEALLATGARLRVISPDVSAQIEAWAAASRVHLEKREYRPGDLQGARLAYAATGDPSVNLEARNEADSLGVWLNVVDDPDRCDFFAPAVLRRGDLAIAISTGGSSPALASRLRRKLEREIGPEFDGLLRRLAELRERYRRERRPLAEARDEIERLIDAVLGEEDREP